MITIDSPFHITFSDTNELPLYACIGKCKSVLWASDIDDQMICNKCGGEIETAIIKVHYRVLRKNDNRLSLNDFKNNLANLSRDDKALIKSKIGSEEKVGILNIVKPEYIDKAQNEWA